MRYSHAPPCAAIEIVEAAHPVPDARSADAARRMLALAQLLDPDDQLVAWISGDEFSLLSLPPVAVSSEAKQAVNKALLRSSATIRETSCVRKHLSAIKGGRLAAVAHPVRGATLILSDIPGDDPSLVVSGPTFPDAATRADTLDVVARHQIAMPEAAMAWLGSSGADAPRPTAGAFAGDICHVIGTARIALAAAAARSRGITAHVLSDAVEGEASQAGLFHAAIARHVAQHGQPFAKPCVLLSGGGTTVIVRGDGRGGRNAEFLLVLAEGIVGHAGVPAPVADTDGIDGSEDNAGAFCDGDTARELMRAGISPREALSRNDAYSAFVRDRLAPRDRPDPHHRERLPCCPDACPALPGSSVHSWGA